MPRLTVTVAGITALRMPTLTFKVTEQEARLIRSRARTERVTVVYGSTFSAGRVLRCAPARTPAEQGALSSTPVRF